MAAGGQGAPLVPFADWLLFHRDDRSVICLNIGGIANVTVVTPELEDVVAFDTGPGNMAIDGAARLLTHGEKDMDEGGAMAADGQVVDEFLEYLLGREYFQQPPPKSTGREEFGTEIYLRDAIAARSGSHPPEDLMATATYAVARSILDACERFILPHHDVQRLIIGGGGAHNDCLVSMLREGFREMAPETVVRLTDEYGLPADAREAVAFALLGHETLCGRPSNVPRATGAAHPAVLGKITLFP
jgi:anhydro-N-acetylmuramic acid kinase